MKATKTDIITGGEWEPCVRKCEIKHWYVICMSRTCDLTMINHYRASRPQRCLFVEFWTVCDPVCSGEKQTSSKASEHKSMHDRKTEWISEWWVGEWMKDRTLRKTNIYPWEFALPAVNHWRFSPELNFLSLRDFNAKHTNSSLASNQIPLILKSSLGHLITSAGTGVSLVSLLLYYYAHFRALLGNVSFESNLLH